MLSFNQYNSHHKLTLGGHCKKAVECLNNDLSMLYFATLLHDCGKIETASFVNSKGEITDECHYYNHQNVSAYKALFYISRCFNDNEILYICQLIRWHMQPYFVKDISDWLEKRNFDTVFRDYLKLINEADAAAK